MELLSLRICLGAHAHVAPLKDGRVTSPRLSLQFEEVEPLPKAFRRMVREESFDICEMAVVTHLLAHHFGRPLTGLAIPLWCRLPHTNLMCGVDAPIGAPSDLNGTTMGVRSYTQTSCVWVRGVLASEYEVDLSGIRWLTSEDSHLAEYTDPDSATRIGAGMTLRDALREGTISALMGERIVDPTGVRTVIPEAEQAALEWIRQRQIVPVNHCVVVRSELLEQHPWLAAELMELFDEARRVAEADGALPPPAYGLSANRTSLQLLLDHSANQGITPRRYLAEELYLSLDPQRPNPRTPADFRVLP